MTRRFRSARKASVALTPNSCAACAAIFVACARPPSTTAAAPPCATDAPAVADSAASGAPENDTVFMQNSGPLHVFALPAGSPPIHQYLRGVPANLALTDGANAPTRMTVLEPLRFDAITLFPAFYLQREVVYPAPRVTIAKGTALHRVERTDATHCGAYVGFSVDPEPRRFASDGGEVLGHYAPDLEFGPVEVPCDALGGASKDLARLASASQDGASDDAGPALRLTPSRDEDGSEHYDETELRIFEQPTENSASISAQGNADGSEILATSSATLLDKRPSWKKIRLVISEAVAIEGWVAAGAFEPDDGAARSYDEPGFLGGSHRGGPAPTYCAGTLAAGTRVFSPNGVVWATVASAVDAAFDATGGRIRLLNFFGPYRDAFCAPGSPSRDTQGIASCIGDAEVRPSDVTLRCPAGKN